jgi:glycine cleavage system protein P-like pyridoxal-binding family
VGSSGGYDLGGDYPRLEGCMLLCCTETNAKADIDGLVDALKEASHA